MFGKDEHLRLKRCPEKWKRDYTAGDRKYECNIGNCTYRANHLSNLMAHQRRLHTTEYIASQFRRRSRPKSKRPIHTESADADNRPETDEKKIDFISNDTAAQDKNGGMGKYLKI